jgi:RHS repeat-associated protein
MTTIPATASWPSPDPRGITFVRTEYDPVTGRVVRQLQADGGVWQFAYTVTAGIVTATTVTDPRGQPTIHRFNSLGFTLSVTDALGQTTVNDYEETTNLLRAVTDPLGRVTRYAYDAAGNLTALTDAAGHTRTFTYEPAFNKVASLTDPLGNVTRFAYDALGNLVETIDPLGHRSTIAYNAVGQPTSTTDPLGHTTTFDYDAAGNLSRILDPLGHATLREYDAASRLLRQVDPRARVTSFTYDSLNRVTAIVDAIGGVTRFGYDPNGNLLTVTDARSNTTTHIYDAMDRLASRTDPVNATETFEYDGAGNLTHHTDRKGQVATFTYDPLNRRTDGVYVDATTSFAYDAVGRLVRATDSAGGTIENRYDDLDRLVAQNQALGAISYEYDALGRRIRMQAPGVAPVEYAYDAASRVRSITQAPLNPVSFEYDTAGRRTRLTLPNQVSTEYQYDAASRLTALIHRNALGPLGDLTYEYDAAGNRIGVSGSFARTLLPDPVPSATYDAANRQLAFGATNLDYDPNGNATSDGTSAYVWDARNRLVAITGPTSASFVYDGLGRRQHKTISGTSTNFIYDALNPVQELHAAAATDLLTGLAVDEYLARTDSSGARSPLSDALGSTIALTVASGAVEVQYTYAPFGVATTTGLPVGNAFQYTSRENDDTGLYYYRARYYRAAVRRFVSEDPLGFAAGDPNLYAYTLNNPTRLTDPTGLIVKVCTRKIHGPLRLLNANHQYILLPPPGITCGSLDGPQENPSQDHCIPVSGSGGKEAQVMGCCFREVEMSRGILMPKPYVPFLNDCFNVVDRCLGQAGLRNPSAAPRFGPPCDKCGPAYPPVPPLGTIVP